jgi:hypothetical protein
MGRYKILNKSENPLYTDNCPVIIMTSALLKDEQDDKVLVQIKFRNMSDKIITAAKVRLKTFDVLGNYLPVDVDYQYLDLKAEYGQFFGDRTAIELNDKNSRSYEICLDTVVFDDGSVWNHDGDSKLTKLVEQKPLTEEFENDEFIEQYKIDTSKASCYVPIIYKNLWLCSCGTANAETSEKCLGCQQNKDAIFGKLDTAILQEEIDQRRIEAEEKAEREKQLALETQQKADKIKKIVIRCAIILTSILAVAAIAFAIYNSTEYAKVRKVEKYAKDQIYSWKDSWEGDYGDFNIEISDVEISFESYIANDEGIVVYGFYTFAEKCIYKGYESNPYKYDVQFVVVGDANGENCRWAITSQTHDAVTD